MTLRFTILAAVLAAQTTVGQGVPSGSSRGAATASLDFADAANLPTGISPYFVVAVDLNRDGYLDLAASNTVSHSISVFLNQKNGTFGRGVEYPTKGYTPYALAAGDLDGDGDADLVCGNMFSLNYSVFYNKGDGTFQDTVTMKGESGPMFAVVSDLNGDGRPDLGICNIGHDDVSIYVNRGNGRFELDKTYPCKGVVPYSMVAADFDGDGDNDLATGNIYSSNVSVLANVAQGKFGEAKTYSTESLTQIIFPADFDGDGKLDLVTGNGGSDNISVLINDGAGGFRQAVNYPVKLPQGVTAGDIDGDGDVDIATANQSANTTSILLNRGDGTFQPAVDFQVQGLYPTSVLMADVDRNGRLDLVTANSGSNNLSVLYNGVRVPKVLETNPSPATAVSIVDGKLPQPVRVKFNTAMSLDQASAVQLRGSLSGGHHMQVSGNEDAREIRIAQIEQGTNGKSSPAAARFFPGEQVTLTLGSALASKEGLTMKAAYVSAFDIQPLAGTGRFEQREAIADAAMLNGRAGDLDADGKLDLLAVQQGSATVSVYFNGGRQLFTERKDYPTRLLEAGDTAVADVDRDGLLDIVVVDDMLPAAEILFNQAQRTFSKPVRVALSPDGALSRPVALTIADWNGDGFDDLATANRLTDDVTIAFNANGRDFRPPKRYPVGNKPVLIASADLDGNGTLDLLTVNTRADSVSLLMNDGKGVFLKQQELPLLYGHPRHVITRDLNRDGAVDLLIADGGSTELVRFLNNGDGTFKRPDYISVPHPAHRIATTDIDADGKLDLIVGGPESVTLLHAAADGTFKKTADTGITTGSSPIAGDFNGDGAMDVVTSHVTAGREGLTLFVNGTRAAAGTNGAAAGTNGDRQAAASRAAAKQAHPTPFRFDVEELSLKFGDRVVLHDRFQGQLLPMVNLGKVSTDNLRDGTLRLDHEATTNVWLGPGGTFGHRLHLHDVYVTLLTLPIGGTADTAFLGRDAFPLEYAVRLRKPRFNGFEKLKIGLLDMESFKSVAALAVGRLSRPGHAASGSNGTESRAKTTNVRDIVSGPAVVLNRVEEPDVIGEIVLDHAGLDAFDNIDTLQMTLRVGRDGELSGVARIMTPVGEKELTLQPTSGEGVYASPQRLRVPRDVRLSASIFVETLPKPEVFRVVPSEVAARDLGGADPVRLRVEGIGFGPDTRVEIVPEDVRGDAISAGAVQLERRQRGPEGAVLLVDLGMEPRAARYSLRVTSGGQSTLFKNAVRVF